MYYSNEHAVGRNLLILQLSKANMQELFVKPLMLIRKASPSDSLKEYKNASADRGSILHCLQRNLN